MFSAIGTFAYRFRYILIPVIVVIMMGLGWYGRDLGKHVSMEGWYDSGSESSVAAAQLDKWNGRNHRGDLVLLFTAPKGETVMDPAMIKKVKDGLEKIKKENSQYIGAIHAYTDIFPNDHPSPDEISKALKQLQTPGDTLAVDKSAKHAAAQIELKGDSDTQTGNNYQALRKSNSVSIPGVDMQIGGTQAVAGAITDAVSKDSERAITMAIPLVALMLFFVFGSAVAAVLPCIIGGLTIIGANGILVMISHFTPLNMFAGPVVELIGLGIAIDYGLFIVSRFREERNEGYPDGIAVKRSVITAGRTVAMSATLIVASILSLLVFPQGFLKSVAYAALLSIGFASLLSITLLPAILGVLGHRIEWLSIPWFLDFFGGRFERIANFFRRNKTHEEHENSFWGRTVKVVMRRPVIVSVGVVIFLALLIVPIKNLQFGGISEKYLPPDNPTRVAQEDFDRAFPTLRTDPIQVVLFWTNESDSNAFQATLNTVPGFTGPFEKVTSGMDGSTNEGVDVYQATLRDPNTVGDAVKVLRNLPSSQQYMVTGVPVLMQDSINGLFARLPEMCVILVLTTVIIMFLSFGSIVLPIKAVLMSALTLGSTLGILTWLFGEGHFEHMLNFTGGPLMAPVLALIVAVVFGLSTDYEIFLISRMIEARENGATTPGAIQSGIAQTGGIISAAALVLMVTTGAFALSDLVVMKYVAFGLVAALILDATIVRMLLVPAVMKLLGDDCWWAPAWMKKIQLKLGLGEVNLEPEPPVSTRLARKAASAERPSPKATEPSMHRYSRPAPAAPGTLASTLTSATMHSRSTQAPDGASRAREFSSYSTPDTPKDGTPHTGSTHNGAPRNPYRAMPQRVGPQASAPQTYRQHHGPINTGPYDPRPKTPRPSDRQASSGTSTSSSPAQPARPRAVPRQIPPNIGATKRNPSRPEPRPSADHTGHGRGDSDHTTAIPTHKKPGSTSGTLSGLARSSTRTPDDGVDNLERRTGNQDDAPTQMNPAGDPGQKSGLTGPQISARDLIRREGLDDD